VEKAALGAAFFILEAMVRDSVSAGKQNHGVRRYLPALSNPYRRLDRAFRPRAKTDGLGRPFLFQRISVIESTANRRGGVLRPRRGR
jgi:hypothetical protein